MSVNFFTDDIAFKLKDKRKLKSWIGRICFVENRVIGNLNFIFTSKDKILDINVQYLNHNYFTDIITFSFNSDNIVSGDIYICVEKVKENSISYNTSFSEELNRVIIHGVLHLTGYDDTTSQKQHVMRKREDKALKTLKEEFLKI